MSELRECPFCGSAAKILTSAVSLVRCMNSHCGVESPHFAVADQEALIRWWNRRAPDALREAAEEVWASIPATYDESDPMVQRHARALLALGAAL